MAYVKYARRSTMRLLDSHQISVEDKRARELELVMDEAQRFAHEQWRVESDVIRETLFTKAENSLLTQWEFREFRNGLLCMRRSKKSIKVYWVPPALMISLKLPKYVGRRNHIIENGDVSLKVAKFEQQQLVYHWITG